MTVNEIVEMFQNAAATHYDMEYWHVEAMLREATAARRVFNFYSTYEAYTYAEANRIVRDRIERCEDPLEACCEFAEELHSIYMRKFPSPKAWT